MQTYNLLMPTLEEIFARNIAALRKARGETQEQVAEAIGIERVTYQNYEALRRRPKKEIISKLASHFGVDSSSLYKDSHNESKPLKPFVETLPVSRLRTLLSSKLDFIPDEIYALAEKLGDSRHEVWGEIADALQDEIDHREEERAKGNHA